jgi:hypothetical protein
MCVGSENIYIYFFWWGPLPADDDGQPKNPFFPRCKMFHFPMKKYFLLSFFSSSSSLLQKYDPPKKKEKKISELLWGHSSHCVRLSLVTNLFLTLYIFRVALLSFFSLNTRLLHWQRNFFIFNREIITTRSFLSKRFTEYNPRWPRKYSKNSLN